MIKKIEVVQRHFNDFGSLKTYWLFSFSNYVDRDNMEFGALRVFNDDIIMPGKGFPEHPHDTMEIVTIVHEGTLTHTDSMGNKATISKGEVQRMSAGKGVLHSEFNEGDTPVHLFQLWFYPNDETVADYEQKSVDTGLSKQTILASPDGSRGIKIFADAIVSNIELGIEDAFTLRLASGWGCLVYIMEGSMTIKGETYVVGDQARITDEADLELTTELSVKAFVVETRM